MAIYIKDMELPKNCEECRMAEVAYEGFCHGAWRWFDDEWFIWPEYEDGDIELSKPLNCPLVYIPEPLFDNKRKKGK